MDNTKVEGNPTNAVVVAKPEKQDYTLGLFPTDKFLNTPEISRAFGVKVITDRDGNKVGFRTGARKRSEIAADAGLTTRAVDKDRLDGLIRDSQEQYFKVLKAWLLMQPDGALGISRYAFRTDKNGIGTHTVAFRELPKKVQADLQKLADQMGVSLDELSAHLAKLKAPATVEVESTVSAGTSAVAKPA
jgi:hypothetical protein